MTKTWQIARGAISAASLPERAEIAPDRPRQHHRGPRDGGGNGEMFDQLRAEAARLVGVHWPVIRRVAKALEHHDRIDQAEIDRLIRVAERLPAA